MVKKRRNSKENQYIFEFTDGSQFIINGEPDIIYEHRSIVYKGFFTIVKNYIYVNGMIKKVTIQ